MKIFTLSLLLIINTSFAINPDRDYKWTPDKRGLRYEEYQVKTVDNYSINVWEYGLQVSAKRNRTVILVGTDAGNMSFLIWQAMTFIKKGFRVITFDYRGFGKSSDFTINRNMLFYLEFSLDLDSVIKATRKKFPNDVIGLYAMSMGTHISLLKKTKVDFMIMEGFYHNPQKVIDRINLRSTEPTLLPKESKPVIKLRRKTPILIFCATKDNTTVTEDAKEFSLQNNVSIIEFDGEHLSGFEVLSSKDDYGDIYVDKINGFLKESKL